MRTRAARLGVVCAFHALVACTSPQQRARPTVVFADGGLDAGAETQDASAVNPGLDAGAVDGAAAPERSPAHDSAASIDSRDGGMFGEPDASASVRQTETFVYVGGYGDSYPFRSYRLVRETGALTAVQERVNLGDSPTYIAPSPDGRMLYIANESSRGMAGITVAAVASDGSVRKVELERYAGKGLVFASIAPGGRFVLATSYDDAAAVVYEVEADGRLSAPVSTVSFASGAQAHSIRVHESGRWAYVPTKGRDEVVRLAFDSSTGKMGGPTTFSGGDGPRHIAFHPTQSLAYVVNELDGSISVFGIESTGALLLRQSVRTLAGENWAAHILVHPSGKFVYASLRRKAEIVVFSVADDGQLTALQYVPSGGSVPRNFDIDTRGEFLVVANQGDDGGSNGSIQVFSILETGRLQARSASAGLQSPSAVAILER